MRSYETLSEAITGLKQEGYTEDFNLLLDCLECRQGSYKVFADEFKVDKFYRFEGNTDPADEAIVYAISSDKHVLKGLLVNGYGIYSDSITNDMLQKLSMPDS